MLASYIHALEMRARWLRWILESGELKQNTRYAKEILPLYHQILQEGDSMYMDHYFCDMVSHARLTIPDDLKFENAWMQTQSGFLWLEDPIITPKPVGIRLEPFTLSGEGRVRAIGWHYLPQLEGYQFATYMSYGDYAKGMTGFGCWSHFAIRDGDTVLEKVHEFEAKARIAEIISKAQGRIDDVDDLTGYYDDSRETEMKHEIRYVYAAMYLMAQRLTHIGQHRVSPMARNMAQRKRLPLPSFLKVVSLRRMQEERPKNVSERDWQWQWMVRGHWRLQPYSTLGDYKWKYIEAFMKGPEDKPIKPPSHTIFVARK